MVSELRELLVIVLLQFIVQYANISSISLLEQIEFDLSTSRFCDNHVKYVRHSAGNCQNEYTYW